MAVDGKLGWVLASTTNQSGLDQADVATVTRLYRPGAVLA
jgi:hypothetical protein